MRRIGLSLLVLLLFLFSIASIIKSIESTSGEFEISNEEIHLNWSNNYEGILTVTSDFNVTLIFDNSSSLEAKYSPGLNIPIILKNHSGELSNENNLGFDLNSANFSLVPHLEDKIPGRYEGIFFVFNSTNSSENASVKIILDLPIQINDSWIGEFNGSISSESTEYHSFYLLPFPNTTSITVNLTFDEDDLDLFLLANNTLLTKSINKDRTEEKLSYSFINPNLTYEIRIYGNHTSNIPYNGTVVLNALNSSLEKINFGSQNVSNQKFTKSFILTNIGNISIENVEESSEIYYVKEFSGNRNSNFTFFLPGSSLFEKIKIRLIWNGVGSYNFSLFNSSQEVCNSSKKHLNANVSNVEKEEFAEINNSETSNWWRVEVRNESAIFSPYFLIIQAFINSSNWISTNFSNYENKSFDVLGSGNESKGIEVNLTTPPDAISGKYRGFLIYSSKNGAELKIPLEFNLTNRLNITIAQIKEEVVNVSTQKGFVNVNLNITYFNGEKVSPENFYNLSQNMSFELYEANASYKLKTNFTDVSNETDWKFNLTIPMKLPGGRYYILVNLTSELYFGRSIEDPSKQLIVNDTGLFMNASYPNSLRNGTVGVINVTIKNFGPINATNAKIKIINQSMISNIRFLSTNCQRKSTGEEVTFDISAFDSRGCYVAWEVTASREEGTAILLVNGISGNWFRNLTIEIPIEEYYETTTTTIPNITIPTTTTTTLTTTTTISSTTTTTLPEKILLNESFKINSMEPNVPIVLSISKQNILKLQKIVVFVKKSIQNATIIVKESEKPEGMAPPIKTEEGVVFKYLEISLEKISDEDLENVTIVFQVDKIWCGRNDIHPSSISLYRYVKEWKKLPTKRLNETSESYIFESISPGLSLFAIAGEKPKGFSPLLTYIAIGGIVGGIIAYLFWPTKEKTKSGAKTEFARKEKEDLRRPWEELKKKWEEFMKKEKKSK